MDRRTIGTKNPGRCGEVAVSGVSTVFVLNFAAKITFIIIFFSKMHCLILIQSVKGLLIGFSKVLVCIYLSRLKFTPFANS